VERTVLPHTAHSPDLAPSYYQLFGPVKDALRDAILQMTTNWNKDFVMCSEVQAGNFTMIYSVLLNVSKSMLKWHRLCGKERHNCRRCTNHPRTFHSYCNYTFWEQTVGITFVPPLVANCCYPNSSIKCTTVFVQTWLVFSVLLPCSLVEVYRRFRNVCCLLMMETASISETSVNYQTTRCYSPASSHSPPSEPQILRHFCIFKVNFGTSEKLFSFRNC
jgi:hypothetical protein